MDISRRTFLGSSAGLGAALLVQPAASAAATLRSRATIGLRARGAVAPAYSRRLHMELERIGQLDLSVPFLYLDDVFRTARDRSVVTGCGRWLAPSSLVCWSLGLTDLDPVFHGFLFERFINRQRADKVHVCIDTSSHAELMDAAHSVGRWGRVTEKPAMVSPFECFLGDAADERSRAMWDHVHDVTSMLRGSAGSGSLSTVIRETPTVARLYEEHAGVRTWLEDAIALEASGTHSLWPICPPTSELEGEHELSSTTVPELARAERTPAQRAELFVRLSRGEPVPLLGYESRGMSAIVQAVRPRSVAELAAVVALYRRAFSEDGALDEYLRRARGKSHAPQPDPAVRSILAPTLGLVLYQEQLMEIAAAVAGFDLETADVMRVALGKKLKSSVESWRERFTAGAVSRGRNVGSAAETFDLLARVIAYTFTKAHAVAVAESAVRLVKIA